MSTKARWLSKTSGALSYYESGRPAEVLPIAPVILYDDFIDKAVDQTSIWNVATVNSGAVAYNAQVNGAARITTGTADDDDMDMASGICFKAANACAVEIRLAAADVTAAAFCIGFSDAVSEAADKVALDFSNSGAYLSTATDAVCFVLDPDKTASATHAYMCSVKADTDGTPVDTGVVPVAATYNTYRLELDADGTAYGYIDGTLVGTIASAITTSTALCVYIGCINREAAANTWDVDYIRAWQKRV